MEKSNLSVVLLFGAVAGTLLCIWKIATAQPTTSEALLISVLLTVFSVAGSWVASKYYADYSSNKNLRTFALKASEKVTNLSNELDRLSLFLQKELGTEDYDTPVEALQARNNRIDAAVHIIHTLKSVNDKSLSDWQGVIGEELTAQRREQEQREQSLKALLERFEELQSQELEPHHDSEKLVPLTTQIENLRNDLRVLAGQVSGVPLKRSKPSSKQTVTKNCPECGGEVNYRQKPKDGSVKATACLLCGSELYSSFTNGDFSLKLRQPVEESCSCPGCQKVFATALDPVPGTNKEINCLQCGAALRVFRSATHVRAKLVGASQASTSLDEELIRRVRDELPPQPWPHGAAAAVAEALNVSKQAVSDAIRVLIQRGVFKLQLNGKLYTPEVDQTRQQ